MGQGDVPTSGASMRRRKEKRQLEHLAASTARDGTPQASAAHVKLIGDQPAVAAQDDQRSRTGRTLHLRTAASSRGGFHVRAVPIDQPFGD